MPTLGVRGIGVAPPVVQTTERLDALVKDPELEVQSSRKPLVIVICALVLVASVAVGYEVNRSPTWTLNGHPVPTAEIDTLGGPAHCGWGSATFLYLAWPLGSRDYTMGDGRQFIRDPQGVVPISELRSSFVPHAKLPPDAHETGYQKGGTKLYIAPSDAGRAVYIVDGMSVERWPRSDPMTLCS